MSQYTSREIATKLYRYALLVEGEMNRQRALGEITGNEEEWVALEREHEEAQAMANYLHELKERI